MKITTGKVAPSLMQYGIVQKTPHAQKIFAVNNLKESGS